MAAGNEESLKDPSPDVIHSMEEVLPPVVPDKVMVCVEQMIVSAPA